MKLSAEKKERSRKKSSPASSDSSDNDETAGNRNVEDEIEAALDQPGPSRGEEYFEETEQKPKRQKTEAPEDEDAYFSLCEELVSMKRIIEDFTTKIGEKEAEYRNNLQEHIDNMKGLKSLLQQDHQAALDRLRKEQEKEVENLEKTLEEERQAIQAESQESLKPLQEALDSCQRDRETIKARLKSSLQGDSPADLPKCPSCDLPFDDKMIFSCLEGHTICSDCRPQRETCLECSEDQSVSGYPARNTFMEAQMRKLMAGR